jgi:type 1 glutamine amidotransferase
VTLLLGTALAALCKRFESKDSAASETAGAASSGSTTAGSAGQAGATSSTTTDDAMTDDVATDDAASDDSTTDDATAAGGAGGADDPESGAGGAGGASDAMGGEPDDTVDLLIFSKTAGFRHDSIGPGITAISELGSERGWVVDATEDSARFSDESLQAFDVVLWLSTTGDVLDADQQAAFERFIQAGNGFVGVHAASDTEYDWPWYGELVGAYFSNHPEIQDATLLVADAAHVSTAHLVSPWQRRDEWYNFASNPRSAVSVLVTIDESSYNAGEGGMGDDHPIAWYHECDGGRSWYTALGHTIESYSEAAFLEHVAGGIEWAAGN